MVTEATNDMIYYSDTGTAAVTLKTLHDTHVAKLLCTQRFPLDSVTHVSAGWGGENINRLHNNPMTDTSFQIQLSN